LFTVTSIRSPTVLRENVGDSTAVPAGNRSLHSVNFPDRYVRNRNSLGYLEPVNASSGTTDRQDATFTIGAGLANNHPGFSIRHYNYVLRTDRTDGGATRKADASFTVTSPPG
jgi:hypothetical protein